MTLERGVQRSAPPSRRPPQEEIVERLRRGDGAAYEELVRREAGRLLASCRRILRDDEEEARDVVQEAFFTAFQRIGSFKGDCQISTWLFRIAVNAALMRLRSRRRRPESPIEELLPRYYDDGHRQIPDGDAELPEPEAVLRREEARRAVREAIDRLPDTYRVVLLLRDIEQRSTGETADMLGVTPTAVKLRLHRARQALRELLGARRSDFLN